MLRCAASYDRWLGSGQMPADLRSFADAATAAFGPDSRLPELVRERAYCALSRSAGAGSSTTIGIGRSVLAWYSAKKR